MTDVFIGANYSEKATYKELKAQFCKEYGINEEEFRTRENMAKFRQFRMQQEKEREEAQLPNEGALMDEYDDIMGGLIDDFTNDEQFVAAVDINGDGEIEDAEVRAFIRGVNTIDEDDENTSFTELMTGFDRIQAGDAELNANYFAQFLEEGELEALGGVGGVNQPDGDDKPPAGKKPNNNNNDGEYTPKYKDLLKPVLTSYENFDQMKLDEVKSAHQAEMNNIGKWKTCFKDVDSNPIVSGLKTSADDAYGAWLDSVDIKGEQKEEMLAKKSAVDDANKTLQETILSLTASDDLIAEYDTQIEDVSTTIGELKGQKSAIVVPDPVYGEPPNENTVTNQDAIDEAKRQIEELETQIQDQEDVKEELQGLRDKEKDSNDKLVIQKEGNMEKVKTAETELALAEQGLEKTEGDAGRAYAAYSAAQGEYHTARSDAGNQAYAGIQQSNENYAELKRIEAEQKQSIERYGAYKVGETWYDEAGNVVPDPTKPKDEGQK